MPSWLGILGINILSIIPTKDSAKPNKVEVEDKAKTSITKLTKKSAFNDSALECQR